ncbi:AI-2E family transporter [Methylocystis sp. IM3]|uniref:AI-2E family transporter n=1 Tax=unclassified Methylocystis TaxID=2625913 RepID=UPI0030F7C11A
MTQAAGNADDQAQRRPNLATILVAFAIFVLVFHELRWVILPFVLAGLLAYLFNPLVERISARFEASRILGAAAVFVTLLTAAVVTIWIGARPLVTELERVATDLREILGRLAHGVFDDRTVTIFGINADANQIAEAATNGLRGWIGQTGRLLQLASVSFVALFGCILVFVLLFYLLAQGPQIMRSLLWLAPLDQRDTIEKVWARLGPLLWRYICGVLIVVAYAIVAAYVGLGLVLGLRHALFLALLTGFLEMIPVVGPGASALIAGLAAIGNATGIAPIIGYAIYAIALRLSIDQLLGPLVLGAAATLSPVTIIFCFLVGGALFGVSGVILAAPAAIALKTWVAVTRGETTLG